MASPLRSLLYRPLRELCLLSIFALGLSGPWAEANRPTSALIDRNNEWVWSRYFQSLSEDYKAKALNQEFNLLQSLLMQKNDQGRLHLAALKRLRRHLPIELRWLLAAAEIDHDVYGPETIDDTRSALEKLYMHEQFSLSLLESNYIHRLTYEKKSLRGRTTTAQLNLPSLREFFYLFRMWNRLPQFAPPGQPSPQLEQKRVIWARAICRHSDLAFTDPESYLALLSEFAPISMRTFTWRDNTENFFLHLINTVRRIRDSLPKLSPEQKVAGNRVIAIFSEWINSDTTFVFENVDRLLRLGLVNVRELVFRRYTEDEQRALLALVMRSRLEIDSYLVALFALLNSLDVNDISFGRALIEAFGILEKVAVHRGMVSVSQTTFFTQYITNESFLALLGAFNDLFSTKKTLPRVQAMQLLGMHTLRLKEMSAEAYFEWERARLKVVEKALPHDEFREELTRHVSGETPKLLGDKLLAARYLRENMKVPNISEIVARTKKMAMSRRELRSSTLSVESWERNNGELIQVVGALDPLDRELRSYLITTYMSQRVDGPIGARSALFLLAQLGRSEESIRDVAVVKPGLLRRLRSVQAGDSAGTFRVLLKLFPDEGLEIHRILYLHRSEPAKLTPMLLALIEESEKNPDLLREIHRAAEVTSDRPLYQGLLLESWLDQMIRARQSPRPSCSELAEISQ